MSNEVELKFLVTDDVFLHLERILASLEIKEKQDFRLENIYFDTADQELRELDCGLRIRTYNGKHEQTIKLAGQVIAGLHQRPEYTLPMSVPWPDLRLFPTEIWPDGVNVGSLQQSLTALFRTDFHRRTWQVSFDDAVVEIAYDIGFIEANGQQEPINEVELELISGPIASLFKIARLLAVKPGWQLGGISKAQRGYRLAGLTAEPDVRRMGFAPMTQDQTACEGLMTALQFALRHWQFHEQLYMQQPSIGALLQLRSAITLIQHTRTLFADVFAELTPVDWDDDLQWLVEQFAWLDEALVLQRMQFEYRQMLKDAPCQHELTSEIQRHEQQLPTIEQTQDLLLSVRYCQTLLKLSAWMVLHEATDPNSPSLTQPIQTLAIMSLDKSWQELLSLSKMGSALDHASYQRLRELLRHNLQVGVCFAALFDIERQQGFRLPWLNMLGRLSDLEHIEWIFDAANCMACPHQDELNLWLQKELKPRLTELDQIRQQGIGMQPYWE
ncbi:CYTH and CHAD domain-containing protein [Tolumonas lignilytica]|uniref:CYTH and CHAD domain-containing protein n=1 Tax=Tolumonas lignilytica TaxID=1283284 RepID=UPI0004635408|nr:CYTH and CHAD domain-containing protein [Tolumonas lignilytica]